MTREVQRRVSNPVDGIPMEDVALLAVVVLMWSSHVAAANCDDSLILLARGKEPAALRSQLITSHAEAFLDSCMIKNIKQTASLHFFGVNS